MMAEDTEDALLGSISFILRTAFKVYEQIRLLSSVFLI